jgi:F-type H+-transporting ATPase subunit a
LITLPFLPEFLRDQKYIHVNGAILLTLLISVFSLIAYVLIKNQTEKHIVPAPKLTLVNFADILIEGVFNMIAGTLGPDAKKYFPFIASLFIFILFGNLMGLLPFASAPTANPNTTFALGIATFVYYNVMGIRAHGVKGYAAHFLMGLGPFGIFVAILELISHLLRPFSLGLRLFLNLHMDHTIVGTFQTLFAWVLPVPLLLFGVVVCTIQAFVFATLTAVYVQLATEHESH